MHAWCKLDVSETTACKVSSIACDGEQAKGECCGAPPEINEIGRGADHMALAKQERGVLASMNKGNGNGGPFDVQPMRLSDDKYLVRPPIATICIAVVVLPLRICILLDTERVAAASKTVKIICSCC